MKPNKYQSHKRERKQKEFDEKVIEIKRTSKKTKGGNKISFSALVVIGDHKGRAGVGFGKAPDVVTAIQKGVRLAKRDLVTINIVDDTISHETFYKRGAAKVILKPAPKGTGVIAGGAVRAVVEAFGIKNIVSKRMGTTNKASNVHATFDAIKSLKPAKVKLKTIKVEENKTESKKTVKPVKTNQQPAKKTVKSVAKKVVEKKEVKKITAKKEINKPVVKKEVKKEIKKAAPKKAAVKKDK